MATLTVRSVGVLRSTYYLKGGNTLVPSSGSLYPPLRVLLRDSQATPKLTDSQTNPILLDSQMRALVRS